MKSRDLAFSTELKLPLDMATETLAFLGRKGRGKTYGAQRLFELLHDHAVQCIALDPVGNWWSLRVGKDGGAGLPVYVFGGPRGDVPILPDAGAFVARVIVEKGISVVLDVSRFRKGERKRFMEAFAEEFFHLKKDAPSAVHLFVEEAHKFVPQFARDGEERMLGAMEDIIRIGRNYGIGASLISQRAASVNKDVLTQVECLIAFQVASAQDRKAIKDWVAENDEAGLALLADMKSLQRGEALLWSPSALQVFRKIHVTAKRTLDASSTPKIGEKARKPVKLAPVDLENIANAMQEVVTAAAENDIGALKRKLAAQAKTIQTLEARKPVTPPVREILPVVTPRMFSHLEKASTRLEKDVERLAQVQKELTTVLASVRDEVARAFRSSEAPRPTSAAIGAFKHPPMRAPSTPKAQPMTNGEAKLDGPALRVLGALAWFEAIGITQPSTVAVAFMSDYSGENGAFNNVRGRLRSMGYVDYPVPGTVALTDEGRKHAPWSSDVPRNGEGLREAVLKRLDGPQQRVLGALIAAYPRDVTSDDLAKTAGYGSENGAFNNVRGRLRTLGLATYPTRGRVRAADLLFPDSN